jgi:hypothetical protein
MERNHEQFESVENIYVTIPPRMQTAKTKTTERSYKVTGPVRKAPTPPVTGPVRKAPTPSVTGPVRKAPGRPATGPVRKTPGPAVIQSRVMPLGTTPGSFDSLPPRPGGYTRSQEFSNSLEKRLPLVSPAKSKDPLPSNAIEPYMIVHDRSMVVKSRNTQGQSSSKERITHHSHSNVPPVPLPRHPFQKKSMSDSELNVPVSYQTAAGVRYQPNQSFHQTLNYQMPKQVPSPLNMYTQHMQSKNVPQNPAGYLTYKGVPGMTQPSYPADLHYKRNTLSTQFPQRPDQRITKHHTVDYITPIEESTGFGPYEPDEEDDDEYVDMSGLKKDFQDYVNICNMRKEEEEIYEEMTSGTPVGEVEDLYSEINLCHDYVNIKPLAK